MSKPIVQPDVGSLPSRSAVPTEALRLAKTASSGTKTDFRSLLASSLSESRHDPMAHNKRSSAAGAFQFTERTWLDLVRRHGALLGRGDLASKITVKDGAPTIADPSDRAAILALRSDTGLAGALAARYFDENRAALTHNLGRKVSENEVRMAYLLGASGATKLLRAAHDQPGIAVDKVVPAAVHSNPGLFHDNGGAVKTAAQAVTSLDHHFTVAMQKVNGAVGANPRLSMLLPSAVPVDDEG